MSQRFFTCVDKKLKVMTGWDRPLKTFFLNVFQDDDIIYSNLSDFKFKNDIDYVFDKINSFALNIPSELKDDLLRDKNNDEGNLYHSYEIFKCINCGLKKFECDSSEENITICKDCEKN